MSPHLLHQGQAGCTGSFFILQLFSVAGYHCDGGLSSKNQRMGQRI